MGSTDTNETAERAKDWLRSTMQELGFQTTSRGGYLDLLGMLKEQVEQLREKAPATTSDGYHTFTELYDHRHALFCALASEVDHPWKSLCHDDGGKYEGWFIAGMLLHSGMVTYHMPIDLWETFPGIELERAPKWDGHTSNEAIFRLIGHANPTDDNRARPKPIVETGTPEDVAESVLLAAEGQRDRTGTFTEGARWACRQILERLRRIEMHRKMLINTESQEAAITSRWDGVEMQGEVVGGEFIRSNDSERREPGTYITIKLNETGIGVVGGPVSVTYQPLDGAKKAQECSRRALQRANALEEHLQDVLAKDDGAIDRAVEFLRHKPEETV